MIRLAFALALAVGAVVALGDDAPPPLGPADSDRAFARALEAGDGAAFAALVDPEARFAGGSAVLRGRGEVSRGWAPLLDPERRMLLTWEPDFEAIAASGELAVTTGPYRFVPKSDKGSSPGQGRYVTVWRRGEDGRWRVAIDLGTPPRRTDFAPPTPVPLLAAASDGVLRWRGTGTLAARSGDLDVTLGEYELRPGGDGAVRYGLFMVARVEGTEGDPAKVLEVVTVPGSEALHWDAPVAESASAE